MKLIVFALFILLPFISHASLTHMAAGYVAAKALSKKKTKSSPDKTPTTTELKELKSKIMSWGQGWAFEGLDQGSLTVNVDLSGYSDEIISQAFNDYKNDKLAVTLKNKTMTFDWSKYYCDNYDSDAMSEMYRTVSWQIAGRVKHEAFGSVLNQCPIFNELSDREKSDLLGSDLFTDPPGIGGVSRAERMFGFRSLKSLDGTAEEVYQASKKLCDLEYKDFWSKLKSKVFSSHLEYFVKKHDFVALKKERTLSHKQLCSQKVTSR